jgi:hypothetical protein
MVHIRSHLPFGFLAILTLSLCSCGSYVHVSNNSYADMQAIPCGFPYGSSFYIELPEVGENALFAKEVVRKITTILRNKGYEVVRTQEAADYTLAFTIDMKSYVEKVVVPRYIPGPVKTKHSKVMNCFGIWTDIVEETATSGHYVDVEEERLVFKKDFSVKVFDSVREEKTGDEELIWNAAVSSSNGRSDLRAEIDYLLLSAFKHFGRNTQKKVYADVQSRDVKSLRRNYFRA